MTRWAVGRSLNHLMALIGLLLLAACADVPPALTVTTSPMFTYLGGGQGSQYGNYETHETGEIYQSPTGPCAIAAWDRPISGGWLVRYLSAACPAPQPGRPDAVRIIDLGRQVLAGQVAP